MKSLLSYIIALFASLLIFVGLPLLGWGFGDLSAFWTHPARVAYVIVVVGLQIFALAYNPRVGRNPENRKSGVAQHKLDLILIQIFSLAIVYLAPFSDSHSFGTISGGNAIRIVGIFLIVPGFLLMQMAEKYLDKQFSVQVTLQKNHKLIQNGPYKFIRHPRYLGILTFFLGISTAFRSLLTIGLVIALAFVFIWRIGAEEALMKQEFGAEWDAYCKRSWRILPLVY